MNSKKIILASIISGAAALIYEIAWMRPLQFILGSTTYTLSLIYATFMFGLGLGSILASKIVKKKAQKTFSIVELSIGFYGVFFFYILNFLPDLYAPLLNVRNNFVIFQILNFILVLIMLLIPTTLMGMTWPLLLKIYNGKNAGKDVGTLYASNNLGAIFGSLFTGLIFIPLLGIKYTVLFAGLLNILIGLGFTKKLSSKKTATILIAFTIFSCLAPYNIHKFYVKGFFRTLTISETSQINKEIIFHKEGKYATINVLEEGNQIISLLINGKSQSGTSSTDLRVNHLLAYLPLLLHSNPQNALIIGLGTGTTTGHLAYNVDTTTLEIEPVVLEAAEFFKEINRDVLNNPRAEIIIDDGRNYLMNSNEKFDIIVPEASDPWQDISTMFYSQEFFELGKDHLNKNGLFVQWVPIYLMGAEEFKMFYATFNSVFSNIEIFANVHSSERLGPYPTELIFVGSNSEINLNNIAWRYYLLDEESRSKLTNVIFQKGVRPRAETEDTPDRIILLKMFDNDDLKNYVINSPIITDNNLLLEFSTARNVFLGSPVEVLNDLNNYLRGVNYEG